MQNTFAPACVMPAVGALGRVLQAACRYARTGSFWSSAPKKRSRLSKRSTRGSSLTSRPVRAEVSSYSKREDVATEKSRYSAFSGELSPDISS